MSLRSITSGLFSALSRPHRPSELIGCWHLERDDGQTPQTEIQFCSDGRLLYSTLEGDRWQIIRLTWRVEGDMIISDQPSAPREERTFYELSPDGTLTLTNDGKQTRYRKGPKRAPVV
jgi:hypothetical protein